MKVKRAFIVTIDKREFVTYPGLLDAAHEDGLKSITTQLLQFPAPENHFTAIVHATVVTERGSFDGIGDANADNVGKNIARHAIRMSETRAKARALRDALNVSEVAIEELADEATTTTPEHESTPDAISARTPPELLDAMKAEARRLQWNATTLTAQTRLSAGGRGPMGLTADQATAVITAFRKLPSPEPVPSA